jgi:dolichyl-phosphate beta-glucosyltransferase
VTHGNGKYSSERFCNMDLRSLSIIIPAYNEERRLSASLNVILNFITARQFEFAEIIVVDDGSTDATAACVTQYARHHSTVRLLRNPGNRGKGLLCPTRDARSTR